MYKVQSSWGASTITSAVKKREDNDCKACQIICFQPSAGTYVIKLGHKLSLLAYVFQICILSNVSMYWTVFNLAQVTSRTVFWWLSIFSTRKWLSWRPEGNLLSLILLVSFPISCLSFGHGFIITTLEKTALMSYS